MDWTGWADGFVLVMQALSCATLIAGAALWVREGLRAAGAELDAAAVQRDPAELRRAVTQASRL